jgi:uncharacterized membrane protein YoaT (DUF817 family)
MTLDNNGKNTRTASDINNAERYKFDIYICIYIYIFINNNIDTYISVRKYTKEPGAYRKH